MECFDPRIRLPGFFTSLFTQAVWRMKEAGQMVYLTFDDGPIPEVTPWVLDLLAKEDIKATFFCVGENVQRYPKVYQQILDGGHSVGNHTFSHLQGFKTNDQAFFSNIEQAAGLIDSNLFRPPHGLLKASQYNYLKKKYSVIMWDLISCDYNKRFSPERIYKNVRDFVRPGSIVTFHDSEKAMLNLMQALPPSIKWMKEQGYCFKAIPYNQKVHHR